MAVPLAALTVQRDPGVFLDPVGVENMTPPPQRCIKASLTSRVWAATCYSGAGLAMGSFVGALFQAYFVEDQEAPGKQKGLLSDWGAWIGGGIGASLGLAYSSYRDHYVHFQLRADLIGSDQDHVRKVALEKANTIFKNYAQKKFAETDSSLCDNILTCQLFIYPVQAGDGKIYEHAAIYKYVTENYPVAMQAYDRDCRRFPDENIRRPSSSPVGAGDVMLDSLKLHVETMKNISDVISEIFKELNQSNESLQRAVDESYQRERFCVLSTPQTVLISEEILAVDEKALALKLCTKQALSVHEVFVIKQLFDFYVVEARERDDRIFKGICTALFHQRQQNIIDDNRYIEEMQALSEWYAYAKGLYT